MQYKTCKKIYIPNQLKNIELERRIAIFDKILIGWNKNCYIYLLPKHKKAFFCGNNVLDKTRHSNIEQALIQTFKKILMATSFDNINQEFFCRIR